jgi:hypothetical protein
MVGLGRQEDPDVPVRASTWTSLMDAVATTPAARRLSTSTSGKPPCLLSSGRTAIGWLNPLAAGPLDEAAFAGCKADFATAFKAAGAKGSLLSVIPPDTPEEGGAAGNARRQSTASSMMM